MRTTHRIAKKYAAEMVATCLHVPYVLAHAKPSFYQLSFGTMRTYLYQTIRRECRANARVAKLAAWRWAESYRFESRARVLPPQEPTE